jgi:hypothetical protein
MQSLILLTTMFWGCLFVLAARMMAVAQSPPAAYAAALLGVVAIGGLGLSLLIICLAAL